jgi:hypothetical protein
VRRGNACCAAATCVTRAGCARRRCGRCSWQAWQSRRSRRVELGEASRPPGRLAENVISPAKSVRFTLDYPFERPFTGVVTGEITLRRTIDAIRAGFRKMYEGSTQRDMPGVANKDVTGTYGQAFHVIDDLVIETIELCADDSLSIFIGS